MTVFWLFFLERGGGEGGRGSRSGGWGEVVTYIWGGGLLIDV